MAQVPAPLGYLAKDSRSPFFFDFEFARVYDVGCQDEWLGDLWSFLSQIFSPARLLLAPCEPQATEELRQKVTSWITSSIFESALSEHAIDVARGCAMSFEVTLKQSSAKESVKSHNPRSNECSEVLRERARERERDIYKIYIYIYI